MRRSRGLRKEEGYPCQSESHLPEIKLRQDYHVQCPDRRGTICGKLARCYGGKKEGKLKGSKDVTITDLPGIYSLSPYTLEEVVSRNYLMEERPDAILNLVDASNIERNLYLTTQLTEMGFPSWLR